MHAQRFLVRRCLLAAAAAIGLCTALAPLPAHAGTPRAQNAEIAISPSTQTQPTGAPQTYSIAVSCFGTGGSECGPNVVVRIPLNQATTPSMDDATWTYAATSPTDGLITSGPTVRGGVLTMTLDAAQFTAGFSSTIRLTVTPPNGITPTNTSWSLRPTIAGDAIATAAAPVPAHSTATAAPQVSISKSTADGGSVYEVNQPITFNLNARCTTASAGGLYPTSATIVERLPDALSYVSSTPVGGVYDPTQHTVTWTVANGALSALPSGCRPEAAGPNLYSVTATAPATVPVLQPIKNTATFTATGPDATNPAGVTSSTSAQVPLNFVAFPPTGPGLGYASIAKTSLAPIPQAGIVTGNGYVATYPGDWVPVAAGPAYQVGAAAASYQTTVTYPLVGVYQSTVIDPLPCLDLSTGNVFSSGSSSGAPCENPAFTTQVIQVTSAGADTSVNGLGRAYAAGWRPQAILANGSTVNLVATKNVGLTASNAYFAAPAGSPIATIVLAPDDRLTNRSLQLTMWGFADRSLANLNASLNELRNTATVIPEITAGSPLQPLTAQASLFTIPQLISLGVSKQFGTPGAGLNGTTQLTIIGAVTTPAAPLAHDIVLTDLLPLGLTWSNPTTSTTATLVQGAGATTTTVPADVALLRNYKGSGRQLIRITIARSAFSSKGAWRISLPTNFLLLKTPTELGLYPNSDQIFLAGLGAAQIADRCITPTQTGGGISSATFESDNHLDLAGDGFTNEQYCQNSATLQITGTGAAFTLQKSVQGALDALPKGPLGIGTTTPGGNGTFTLTWSNVGSDTMKNVVIYDLLPRVGDVGVSAGQTTVPRGSGTETLLTGLNVPSGVSVQYSTSVNPCRPEVFANASNSSCVDDWSSTPPSQLSTTTALRFFASANYARGTGFAVNVLVALPVGVVNTVAWNSAATNAQDQSNPQTTTLAAEPPKVGLVAPSSPDLVTATQTPVALAHASASDTVTITGTGGAPGTLTWHLVGPVPPTDNSCDLASFADAPITVSGTVAITGDGTLTVGPVTLGTGGCYSWAYELLGTIYPYEASLLAGGPNEQTTVTPYPPHITTTASTAVAGDGSWSIADTIVVDSIPVGDPTPPSPLAWTLYGPVPLVEGNCRDADFSGAAVVTAGSIAIAAPGNGTYTTPSTTVSAPGCYSFGTSLPATSSSLAVDEAPGVNAESVAVIAPTITTATSSPVVTPGAVISDHVTIAGTGGGTGSLAWQLLGPVPTPSAGCADATFTAAPIAASGTVATSGDETLTTGPVTVTGVGCFAWSDVLTPTTTPGFPGPVTSSSDTNEITEVALHVTSLATHAHLRGSGATSTLSDTVTITGLHGVSSTLTWTLLGPVATPSGGCSDVDWSTAPIAATGSLVVTGDGVVETPATTVPDTGCYSFDESLSATASTSASHTAPGEPLETVERTSDQLPFTGGNITSTLVVGGALLLSGAALGLLARRRRTA